MAKVIAIDGPSGAGKSSVSRIVGERLGFLHVDSGALYRIMTWQCLERGVDTSDQAAVAAMSGNVAVECRPERGAIVYYVDGEEPGNRIRTPEINAHASPVATVIVPKGKPYVTKRTVEGADAYWFVSSAGTVIYLR